VRHNQALFSETLDARQYGWIDENCNSSAIGLITLAEMNTSGFFREKPSALLKRSSFFVGPVICSCFMRIKRTGTLDHLLI